MNQSTKNNIIVYTMGITIFLVCLFLWMFCATAQAQEVVRQGNTFVAQRDTTKKNVKESAIETDYLYVDTDGKCYTVYLSKNGKAFIKKTSKKSGRTYRKYLPKISKIIQDEKGN